MKISAIIQARALAFVELVDLDPKGRVFLPDVIKQIQQRYGFMQVPKVEEINNKKTLELRTGKIEDKVVDALKIYDDAFVLETHSDTSDSKMILEELFEWSKREVGITYEPEMIRWGFVSMLTFYSEINVVAQASTPASKLAFKISQAASEIWGESLSYEARGMSISHDPLVRKNSIASFLLMPRADTPYENNKFYSEAPLPTDVHIRFLQEYEADVVAVASQNLKEHRAGRRKITFPEE